MVRGQRNPLHVGLPGRLKRRRKELDLNPHALSLAAGLAHNTIADLESGGRAPGLDTIERLAAVLGVSPCWLAFGVDSSADSKPDDMHICQRLAAARKNAELSGRALADAAETSSPTVLRIEKGALSPRVDTVEKLAKALNVAPCWLAFGLGPAEVPLRRRKLRSPRA